MLLLVLCVLIVSETIIIRIFQRNNDCYCDYFILIVFNYVRFRLRLGCPGRLVSLNGPSFHITPVDFLYLYSNVTYIYPVSCLVEIKLFQIVKKSSIYSNCVRC